MLCESHQLYLREIKISDAKLIATWKDESLARKMSIGFETEITTENQEADIKRSIDNEQLYCMIVLKTDDKAIGYVRINWMDDENKFAWLRFGLGCERGNGYSKDALKLFIRKLFDDGVHRIDAEVFEFNTVSFHLLKSLGFKHEGTKRDGLISEGEYFDMNVLGLLEDDFVE